MRTLGGVRLGSALLVGAALLAAACARQDAGEPDPGPDLLSHADGEVALRVESVGGNVPAPQLATALPFLTVYGDGQVITEGPQILIYPGPALPNLQVQHISRDDVRRLVELAIDAGVDPVTDAGLPSKILDASSTRFTVLTADGPRELTVYALPEATGRPELTEELTAEQRAARTALEGLLADLTDLPGTLGADAVGEAGPYAAAAVAAVAQPWQPAEDDGGLGESPELAWPGPDLPGEVLEVRGEELRCLTVSGEEGREVLATAASANDRTVWTSGGEKWQVELRPLLPDESGCDDLLET
jgi:hypothetical protein